MAEVRDVMSCNAVMMGYDDVAAEDPDPNGVAAWAAWAASTSAPADSADQWQAWQAAASAAGYEIGPEAAAAGAADNEPEAPPGMSDVEDDVDQLHKKEPKVSAHRHFPSSVPISCGPPLLLRVPGSQDALLVALAEPAGTGTFLPQR